MRITETVHKARMFSSDLTLPSVVCSLIKANANLSAKYFIYRTEDDIAFTLMHDDVHPMLHNSKHLYSVHSWFYSSTSLERTKLTTESSYIMEMGTDRKISIEKASFDTSEWNTVFAERFENSWDNVGRFIYNNKSIIPFNLGNRTMKCTDKTCVATSNGKLFDVRHKEYFDMSELYTICGFPVIWIIMNWMLNASGVNNDFRINSSMVKLYNRIKQNHQYIKLGGSFNFIVLENDRLVTYDCYKTIVKRNKVKIDVAHIEAILNNPDVWSHGYKDVKRVPLLTNKDME